MSTFSNPISKLSTAFLSLSPPPSAMASTTLLFFRLSHPQTLTPKFPSLSKTQTPKFPLHLSPPPPRFRRISAASKPPPANLKTPGGVGGLDFGWWPAFPHVLTASMANFLFGYHIGVMNGPIEAVARALGFDGDPFLEGLVVSIFIVGAFIGSISSASLINRLGCRRTLQIDVLPLIVGALLSAQAHSLDEILWGRFLVGLGIGVNTVLVPIYISEVSPTKYRGSLGTLCQIGTCLGIITSLSLGLLSENDSHWWRTMLYTAAFPGFVVMLGMQFAVESPRWLCKVGRIDDGKRVIIGIWSESDVQNSIEEIQSVIKNERSDHSGWLELLEEPHNKVACIGASLFILQQFSGINGVLYFSSLTFKDVGLDSGALASLFVGLTNFAGALFALYLMDKQGRQRLLIGSYLGMVKLSKVFCCCCYNLSKY